MTRKVFGGLVCLSFSPFVFIDTENEVSEGNLNRDYDIILKRLAKLEKQIARGRKRDIEATEMSTKITQAIESVAAMRRAVDNVVSDENQNFRSTPQSDK